MDYTDKIDTPKEIEGLIGVKIHELYEVLVSIDKINWVRTGKSNVNFNEYPGCKYYKFERLFNIDLDNIKLED
jgi:hypothetical protein